MTLSIELRRGAREDFDEAADWYRSQEFALGASFMDAVASTLERVRRAPFSFPVVHGSNTRRALVRDFPYAVIFRPNESRIHVYSIFHTSRNPVIWRGRID